MQIKNIKLNNMHYKTNTIKGFTLLEVMIAMVIFAVGLLGLAGIQALSLESSHSSYSRSQAVLLAYEMIDRMKANSQVAADYALAIDDTLTDPAGSMCNDNDLNVCSATQMATFDLWQWKNMVSDTLPSGTGSIVGTTVGTITTYTVTVHWDEDRTGATGTTCPPAVATDLRCFQLVTTL